MKPGRDTVNLYLNWLVIVLGFALPVYRQWTSIAVPLIFLLWLVDGRLGEKVRALREHGTTLAILSFILVNVVSLLWSDHPADGLDYLSKYRYLLLVPVIATSVRPRYRRQAFAALTAGTSVSLLLLFLTALGVLTQVRATPANPAVTMSHLDYSIFLALAALLAVNHLIHASLSTGRRLLWMTFAVAAVTGLFVNIGRSGQLAFFGSLIVVVPLLLKGRWRWRAPAALAIVGVVLATVYAAAPVFRQRLDDAAQEIGAAAFDQDYDTNQGERIAGMIVAVEIIKSHPFLGTGVGDNMVEFRRLLDGTHLHLRDEVYWFPHLHNQYLQVATELGLVGVISLLSIFALLFRGHYADREARIAALILGLVYLFGFMGDPYFHKQLPLALFAFTAGLLSAPTLSVWRDGEAE